jgi:hypothetical protein
MPLVFRVMKKSEDGFPTLSPTSLGARPGIDVDLDQGTKLARYQHPSAAEATPSDNAWSQRQ